MLKHALVWIIALLAIGVPCGLLKADDDELNPKHPPPVEPAPIYDPNAPVHFEEAQQAIAHFKKPADLKVSVWAAEPQLINPVAMNVDNHGRVWLVETNRYRYGGILDDRSIYGWIDEELANRSVADRTEIVKRHWPDSWPELAKNPDRIRLLEDSSKQGRCDKVTIWADGFNHLEEGIAAGILERKGTVYFTDMPNLWMLKDTKGAGFATERTVLSTGYGVRYSYEGHDLHGLRFGPDGKLYFSCGDRGFVVKTKEGNLLSCPDYGGVLRCDPDGSNLEVFAYGLRNPQKLCFDEHGNLFTGDNNSDRGDPARWCYVTEGSDNGWRVSYQHINYPSPGGVLLMENLMAKEPDSTQLYMTPPIEHIGNGPSGCTFYPGTGMSKSFDGHFLMCDFKGGITNSGLWSFVMKPHGASFVMEQKEHYVWQILPTDVEFIPSGGFYVSDWIDGWLRPNKGRIYRFYNEQAVADPLVAQTAALLDQGFEKRSDSELAALLSHIDQRVRQEAQFELADRGDSSIAVLTSIARHPITQKDKFDTSCPDLARLHAIWGLGQIARKNPSAATPLIELLSDADLEVRANAAKVLGESKTIEAFDALIGLLKDEQPRVQFFAAMALGKLGKPQAVGPILELLGRSNDKDAYIRHSCVLALTRLGDLPAVLAAANNSSAAVRLGVLLTLRRWERPEVAQFLTDADPRLVLEAARAINDVPINPGRPQLAALLANHKLDEKILRRALNANFREGQPQNAQAIAQFAAADDAPESVRVEALDSLNEWEHPSIRDHIMALIWPLPQKARDELVVDKAVQPVLAQIVQSAPAEVRLAALNLALKTGLQPLDVAVDVMHDPNATPAVQSAALAVLAAKNSPRLADALQYGLLSKSPALRKQAISLQTKLPDALLRLNAILIKASPADQQAVFSTLPQVGSEADGVLADWMDKLLARQVPAASTLDLLEAAQRSKSPIVMAKIAQFNATRDPADNLGNYRECLEGGDAKVGRRIFVEKQEVSCVRCHAIRGLGGSNVGPNLTDIGKRQTREYILESIVDPNAKIAPGFESANVKLNNGKFYTGIVKSETADQMVLDTGTDHGLVTISKSDIKKRTPALSPMPQDIAKPLSKRELRDLVEFLAERKG